MLKFLVLAGCLTLAISAEALDVRTAAQDTSKAKFDPANSARPGICLEILTAIEKVDPEIHFVGKTELMPVKRIEDDIESGKIEAFCAFIKNEARAAKMNFGEPAVFTVKHRIAAAADDNVDVGNFDELRKLGDSALIAVPIGTAFVNFLEKQGGLKLDSGSKEIKANLQKVVAKRVRFHYNADLNFREIENDPELKGKYRVLPAVFASEPQLMVFSKALPKATQEKIMAAVAKIKKSGELATINKKYLGE